MAYHPKSLQFLSVLQIIVGSISLLLGIASRVLLTDFTSFVGFGIWVGIWIFIAGILGFFGSRHPQVPNKCLLGTFMGFTITACVLAVAMLISYSIALAILAQCARRRSSYVQWNRYYTRYYYTPNDCNGLYVPYSSIKAGIGIDSVLLVISILEFIVGLASSIYCCAAICPCCNGSPSRSVQAAQQVVYLQPGMGQMPAAGGGMVLMSGGPPGTVVQPPPGPFIIQQPGQPTFVPVSQPGPIPMQQYVASQTHPPPVAGGVTTGGQTAQTQPTFVPVSQPGPIPMQQYVASQTHPPPVAGGVTTGGQTAQTQPYKQQDVPPNYT